MVWPGLNNGELSQGFLLQQLNNPNVNQRDREMLFIALGHFNATQSSAASENNKPHPVLPNNVSFMRHSSTRRCSVPMFMQFSQPISNLDTDAECKFAAKYADTHQCSTLTGHAASIVFTSRRHEFQATASNFTTTKWWYSTTHSIATRTSIPHTIDHAECVDQKEIGRTA